VGKGWSCEDRQGNPRIQAAEQVGKNHWGVRGCLLGGEERYLGSDREGEK